MRPETKAFLDVVRKTDRPSKTDEQRVLRRLRAAVAAGLTSTVAGPSWAAHPLLAKTPTSLGTLGGKLSVLALCAASAFGSADTPRHATAVSRPASLRPATSVPIPAPSRAAQPPPPSTASTAPPQPSRATAASVERRGTEPSPRAGAPQRATTLRSELELLVKVQGALKRGDAQTALRDLDAHKTTDRRLGAERDAARILSLCMLGRTSEARRAAARFFERHPGSLHADAIARSCANAARIDPD